jgi:uncharacterized protein (TIGR02246 family)
MKLCVRMACVALLSAVACVGVAKAAPPHPTNVDEDADHAAITKAVQNYMDAWNTHDIHAVAMTYAPDCDFVNNFGDVTHGRDGMVKVFTPFMSGPYSDTHQTGTVRSIRFLKPDVAAVDVDWEMTGAKNPDGTVRPTRKGIHSLIMTRQSDGGWLITIMHVHEFTSTPRITPPGTAPATPPAK